MNIPMTAMPVYRVDVVEEHSRIRPGAVRCEIGRNLRFSTEGLESYLFAAWEPVIFDALLVAAAVEFCDKTLPRRSLTWGRDIQLVTSVHDVDLWKSSVVNAALVEALNFVTGDRWTIRFRERKAPEAPRRQGQFTLPSGTRAVIPFSDGLDSWSVAKLYEREHPKELLRVRLGLKAPPRPKAASHGSAFVHVPFRVHTLERRAAESSLRSRGFKFALISGLAAYLAKVDDIVVPESGQGALGAALMPVGLAPPDFRSHPRFTVRMERFLRALLGHRARYRFPQLWRTKSETLLAAVSNAPGATDWAKTRTCWQSSRHVSIDRTRRQCGVCAACLLRRLSVHSAGLSEANESYVWEDLRSPIFKGGASPSFTKVTRALEQHAIAGTLHLARLASPIRFPGQTSGPDAGTVLLGQALELPRIDVETQQRDLWRRHRDEWCDFVNSLGPDSFLARWAQVAA